MKKKKWKHWWDSNLRIMEKINVCSAASDSTFWAIQNDIKHFQNYTWLLNMPAYCFDFNVYKQANVNMGIRSWQLYRRFLGAISFLYHHDDVYPCADPGNFRRVWRWGGGGSKPDWLKKSSDVAFFSSFRFLSVLSLFCRGSPVTMAFSKKTIIKL